MPCVINHRLRFALVPCLALVVLVVLVGGLVPVAGAAGAQVAADLHLDIIDLGVNDLVLVFLFLFLIDC